MFSLRSGTRRPAFTLIELLVVLAIVSLLAAILFPVFAQVREKGRQTACASNLKQLVLAWQMYADDYDAQACPSYYFTSPAYNPEYGWDYVVDSLTHQTTPGLLSVYIPDGRLHQCPDFLGSTNGRPYTGYAYNATYLGGDDYQFGSIGKLYPPCRLAAIVFPAQTAAFADGGYGTSVPKAENYLRAPSDTSLFAAGLVDFRHSHFAEVAYADGHVHPVAAAFPYFAAYPEFGALSSDDAAYGPSMRPASAYAY